MKQYGKIAMNVILTIILCVVIFYQWRGLPISSFANRGEITKLTITDVTANKSVSVDAKTDEASSAAGQLFMKFENGKTLIGFLTVSLKSGQEFTPTYIFVYDYADGTQVTVSFNDKYIEYDGKIHTLHKSGDYATLTQIINGMYFSDGSL